MSRNAANDVLIVGAGIIGLAIAFRLRLAGHAVTIVDRQPPGRGCSFGNAGRIASECIEPLASPQTLRAAPRFLFSADSPLSIAPRYALSILPWLLRFAYASLPARYARGISALRELQRDSLAATESLLNDAGLGSLLKTRGHLLVSERSDAKTRLQQHRSELDRQGITARYLTRDALRQLAPALSSKLAGALYFPDTAHVVEPYLLCRRLARTLEQRGVRVLRGEVDGIEPTSDGRFKVHAGEHSGSASRLVIAAGAWSAPLAQQLGHRLPLETERGYHLTASDTTIDLRLPVESLERHTVMTPLQNGLRITGFVELGGLTLPADPGRYRALRSHLQALLPSTDLSSTSEWMGYRPSLPDHLPVIGRCRRHPHAILACGHQHLGLTLAGITAELVEALVGGREPALDLSPFRCERFGDGVFG